MTIETKLIQEAKILHKLGISGIKKTKILYPWGSIGVLIRKMEDSTYKVIYMDTNI